ncbi:MAG: site-2 protease family protein [Desulfovibrio sp.]|nr:site-2 protease family protein [Desulfovibrio sp.]
MPDFDIASSLSTIAVALVPAMLGIILHEVAHGWAAARLGDPTARSMGRLTLNPLPHIDPVGLLCFVLTSLSGAFVFGWAKPVPVDPRYFRNPVKGMMAVALAGPLTNFLLAIAFALLLTLVLHVVPRAFLESWGGTEYLLKSLQVGVLINLSLGWLNLLPIPPLDGSKVVAYFLPRDWAWRYLRVERWGFVILIVLIVAGVLNSILVPLIWGRAEGLLALFGLG